MENVSIDKPEVKRTGKVIYRILNRISVLKNGDITGYFSQKRENMSHFYDQF